MRLIKSLDIEEYVKRNKKEAENEIPYVIKKLLKNTIDNITGIDVPSGDNTIQTGFDGIIKFNGVNKYLGDKPTNIEIGTDADYLKKANEDIKKRKPKKDENFVFITPFRWNSRTKSKDAWISEKKETYKWNDIKIIDAELLESWLEEDFTTTKYLLEKLNIKSSDIYSISEKEEEYTKKTVKNVKLDFFDYEDSEYESLLSCLEKEFYNIVAPTKEEGILVTLYYLKKIHKSEDVLIIDSEMTWKNLVENDLLHNAILIPNFYHVDGLPIPKNNTTILIYDNEELLEKSDYFIKERTINNLNRALELYYKDDKEQVDYDKIHSIVKNSLGKYMPLKRELFKELNTPKWFNGEKSKLFLYLFFINSFNSSDIVLFEEFNLDVSELKKQLNNFVKEKDPFIVYYKYWDQYRVVNLYNAIDWLGFSIDDDSIEKLISVARKVLLYLEPKYLPQNIEKTYFIEESSSRKYSKSVKEGILKGLIITKLYLQRNNNYTLIRKLDLLVDEYYASIKTEGDFLSFASIADKIVEYNYDKYLKKIEGSIGNENFEKMFNLTNKDTFFSSNEYCHIIWGIEKAINKKEFIVHAVDTLAMLSEMKNTEYKNMGNTSFNTLIKVFLGWDNLTCLEFDEKIKLLEQLIKKHNNVGKKLLKKILPKRNAIWSPLQKPEFDGYDDVKKITYIKEQKDYFEKYYTLYLNSYVKKLSDLVYIYEELYFIEFDCFSMIKNKTLELISTSQDEEKYELKAIISERLRGYRKFHNSAWDLTQKQFDYLTEIEGLIIYDNPLYDYLDFYKYRVLLDDEVLEEQTIKFMELLKLNDENEEFLLTKCENKRKLICDIYKYKHNNKHNVKFLKKLFNNYEEYVETYLRMIYSNETVDEVLKLYNNVELNDLSVDKRIFILSNMGYNEYVYNEIKGKDEESIYWKKLNMYNSDKSNFVYDSCLKYGNYEMCLEIIYEQPDKYDEKCLLLEKIKETKYNISQLDEYKIQKIFECFYDYEQILNFERLAKLEIYYSPILENGTYFLSKEASKSPEVIAELAELIYRDEDGNFIEIDNRDTIVSNCYNKLHNLKIDFDSETALKWCEDFLKIMKEKKRSQIMFHILGQLLARSEVDKDDKMFPIKKVRMIIEHYKSEELENSFEIEKYNQRGVHYIGIGEEEFALYKKYLEWADKMIIEYPETSKVLRNIAETYKKESIAIRDEANYAQT